MIPLRKEIPGPCPPLGAKDPGILARGAGISGSLPVLRHCHLPLKGGRLPLALPPQHPGKTGVFPFSGK
ncbi:MAG: hypothetical protein BAA03_02760 [Caldibacillus debilis]|nr:MAG: hypothetical protein BAA03_02760 [Caldibacillus debilis]